MQVNDLQKYSLLKFIVILSLRIILNVKVFFVIIVPVFDWMNLISCFMLNFNIWKTMSQSNINLSFYIAHAMYNSSSWF